MTQPIVESDPSAETANFDALTGLYNRHFYANYFPDEAKLAGETRKPLSMAVVDIDLFKVQNTNFGYEGGNEVLAQLGPVISEYCLSQALIPIRHSGDEFVILMPETVHEEAIEVAEALRQTVEVQVFEVIGREVQLTVSIGVASFPTHVSEPFDVYDAAYAAMQLAKKKGRNQVCTPAQQDRVLFTRDSFHRLFPCPRIIGRADLINQIKPFLAIKQTMGRPFIVLTGPPGVGKTRLLDHFQSLVDHEESVSFYVQAQPYLVNQPYGVIIELLQHVLRTHPNWADPLREHLNDNERIALAGLVPELIPPSEGPPVDAFEEMGDEARNVITQAFVKILNAMRAGMPLNLFVDDLHWAEAGTVEVLEHLKFGPGSDSMLVMVSARRTTDQVCDGAKAVVELVNNGLKSRSMLRWDMDALFYHNVPEIIDAIIPGLQRNKRVATILTNRSHAIPMVVEEILKYLIQKELIVSDDGVLLVKDFEESDIPETLRDVVAFRMKALEDEVGSLVSKTAVVGTSFDVKTLTELEVGSEGVVLDAIDKGVRVCLLKEDGPSFSFVSHSVQEAVYDTVDKTTRVELHTKIAELEEARRGDALDGVVGKLTFHHERAGNVERARGVLTRLEKYELQTVGSLEAAPPMNPVFVAQISDDVPVLIKDLESGQHLKVASAATALIRKGGFAIKPLLGLVSSSSDLRARRIALQCLNRIGTRVLSILVETLHTTQDYQEKCRLIETLEYYQDDSIVSLLEPFIHFPEASVRREAIRVLLNIGGDKIVPTLLNALEAKTLSVREDAIMTLGKLKSGEAVPALVNIIKKRTIFWPDTKIEEQRHACAALAEMNDLSLAEPLLEVLAFSGWWTLMRNKQPEVRASAAMALARFPAAEGALRRACNDKELLVRSAAQTALNVMRGVDVAPNRPLPHDEEVEKLIGAPPPKHADKNAQVARDMKDLDLGDPLSE